MLSDGPACDGEEPGVPDHPVIGADAPLGDVRVIGPDTFEEHLAGEYDARIRRESVEDVELMRRQLDRVVEFAHADRAHGASAVLHCASALA